MLLEMNVKLHRGHFNLTTQLSIGDTSVGLFGKSGAGKSTVLGLIAGTIQPQSGHIALDGKILFDSRKGIVMPREQRPVGAVLQLDCADAAETVRRNLTAVYNRTLKQRRIFKLNFLIGLLELEPILEHPIELLSAGERQRVALARSLLKSPRLLLLDETFAAIGNGYRMQLLPILKRLQNEVGLPVLYASQSLGEILELTDQLIVLEQGKVLHNGSLLEATRQQGILRYLGIRQIDNILPVTIGSHDYQAGYSLAHSFGLPITLPLRPHVAAGTQAQVSIRAKDIALSRSYIDGISIQNQIKGRICALIASGESMIVQVDCGTTLLAEITPGACRNMNLQEGEVVYCLIKTHSITYLTELDALPYQRVISHGDGHYYLDTAGPASGLLPE
ncbi:molybdenum ABC transporter ATP-binding protein [Candidatus Methylobacter oryzae]|uniref:ATP-binding cassette domain-containing protein n=1 Tax=Candidatus Methylobacter oryzae TaxID=2497749 RepID=A0ABY3C563_9GAMM|nr:ATP-binding cassette domain-containing protein [Candidatus Methylobacter oryzae]TRW89632.1 ATP-binding cassette domain-containing protein [Candidatus Methylobacter oryzae]